MRLVVLLAVAACSSKPASSTDKMPTPASSTDKSSGTTAVALRLEQLVAADTIGVVRQPGGEMFALRYVDQLIVGLARSAGAPACWTELVKRVKTGYQLSLAKGSAYFVIEGELPPQEIMSCLTTASRGDFTTKQEGDLYSVTTPIGIAYAAWRKPYLVIGNRDQVEAALVTPTAETAARWHDLVTPLASVPTYMVRIDRTFDDIVGEHTTSIVFAMDKMQGPPHPMLAGRFIVHYVTSADAEAGERWIREWSGRGQFPRRIPDAAAMQHFDSLAAGVTKTTFTRRGTTLELAFDSDMFGGAEALGAALSKLGAP